MPLSPASPPAHLVDVGQRALTGELHGIDLYGRTCLNDFVLTAQGGHIEHEGLSGTNELIVHLGQEKPTKQKQARQAAQVIFFFYFLFVLFLDLVPHAVQGYSESLGHFATAHLQHTHTLSHRLSPRAMVVMIMGKVMLTSNPRLTRWRQEN